MARKTNHFERLYAAFGMVPNAAEVVCIQPHDGLMCRLVYRPEAVDNPFMKMVPDYKSDKKYPVVEITLHYQPDKKKDANIPPYVGYPRHFTLVEATGHLYLNDSLHWNLVQVARDINGRFSARDPRVKAFADFLQEAGLRRINAKAKLCKAWVTKID